MRAHQRLGAVPPSPSTSHRSVPSSLRVCSYGLLALGGGGQYSQSASTNYGTNGFNGEIYEVIIFGALNTASASAISQAESYLKEKYVCERVRGGERAAADEHRLPLPMQVLPGVPSSGQRHLRDGHDHVRHAGHSV